MTLYGRFIIEINITGKEMLFLLKREVFDCLFSKEDIQMVYRMLIGKTSGELITDEGKYKLTVTSKKRIKICFQNQADNVIYKYNVGIRFLWKRNLKDAMCEGLMDVVAGVMFDQEDRRATDS